jgi:hypothetical protein
MAIRDDRHDLAADSFDARPRLRQCAGVDATVRAPMTAMNDNADRTIAQQFVETNNASFVGQIEGRKKVAHLRRSRPDC